MDTKFWKKMNYDDIRAAYLRFLQQQGIGPNTIKTAYTDTFYLWRRGGEKLFWKAVDSNDSDARKILFRVLQENTNGDASKLVNGYVSHLRRFHAFISSVANNNYLNVQSRQNLVSAKNGMKSEIIIPSPNNKQVEHYLNVWKKLDNYQLQENALDKLFLELCPMNTDISDILLKVSTLNDFYSTNIFSVYSVAKHILSLRIDERLKTGDVRLVDDIKRISINGKERNFYSFASKYCSHHNPSAYPIYDSYVDKVLRYYRKRDGFLTFGDDNLKNYVQFKDILIAFRKHYGLEDYSLKLLDKYLWLLGKDYFRKKYGKKS